ncbi:hypothetical protein PsorP6_011486 [Peronosclerospora sorghi]|uniref:Uncharacterized protein n=1 Tax=Peronosclerospora sorghi TaxID=230839 RepID=A0ACC0WIB0_9STRA|nr:hypothetical protein PsorP6_011486 [Peronosclerospora sorghi]
MPFLSDPVHGHSFAPVQLPDLSPVDRSLFFFRECLCCHEHLVALGKPRTSPRRKKGVASCFPRLRASTSPTSVVCQCLTCGHFLHRACLTFAHAHRYCKRHDRVLSRCTHVHPATEEGDDEPVVRPGPQGPPSASCTTVFTLATLIEELNSTHVAHVNNTHARACTTALVQAPPSPKPHALQLASKLAKRIAPVFLAAGGVGAAIAMGPAAAGVVAGFNVLVASVGAETVMAGIGLTASAAAAATVTHQSKVKVAERRREQMRNGAWAMEICWNCKKNFTGAVSDQACRKDAEFLRRFQSSKQFRADMDARGHVRTERPEASSVETIPDDGEVYRFLFGLFASPGELLGQMNGQLCEAFRKRCTDRHRKPLRRRASFTGRSSASLDARDARHRAKETLQDTKMYVAHMLGATLQACPSLASTPESFRSCTLAVERIIYGDIYALVFAEFTRTFETAEAAFAANLAVMRSDERAQASALLQDPHEARTGRSFLPQWQLAPALAQAEAHVFSMMHATSSPLEKLMLLCDAFRTICCFAETLHESTSNTDMLLPMLCAFFVACPRICGPGAHFVAEIAFIAFFTQGGGQGVEGYVLTTVQAAIQVIVAVDGPTDGHELELVRREERDAIQDGDESESEFYDAVSLSERASCR